MNQQELINKLIEIQNNFHTTVEQEIKLRNLKKEAKDYDSQYDEILGKAQKEAQLDLDKLDLDKVAHEIMLSNSPRDSKRVEAANDVEFTVSPEQGLEFKNLKAFENSDIAPNVNKKKKQDSPREESKEILSSKNLHQLKYKLAYKPGQKPKLTAAPRFRAAPRPAGM